MKPTRIRHTLHQGCYIVTFRHRDRQAQVAFYSHWDDARMRQAVDFARTVLNAHNQTHLATGRELDTLAARFGLTPRNVETDAMLRQRVKDAIIRARRP